MKIENLISTVKELLDKKENPAVINHVISENLKHFYHNNITNKINSNINVNVKKEILNTENKNSVFENKISKGILFSIPIIMFYIFFNAVLVIFDIIDLKNNLSITMTPVIFWCLSSISVSLFSNLFIKKSCFKIENKKDFCINKSYENEIKKITVNIIESISNNNKSQNDSGVYLKNYLLRNLREYEDNKITSANFFLKLKESIKEKVFNKGELLETKKINNTMNESTEIDNYYEKLVKSIQKDKV